MIQYIERTQIQKLSLTNIKICGINKVQTDAEL